MAGLDLSSVVTWIGNNLLIDTVRIVRPSLAAPVLDPATGLLTYPPTAVIYEGPGMIQAGNAAEQYSTIPTSGQPYVVNSRSRYNVLTPLTAPLAAKDDLVAVTAVTDPERSALLNRSWIVEDPSRVSTVEVVRLTPIDEQAAPRGGTP